ncbi:MAG TPA: metallophosphoesterase family protein [Thermomicrobiales bacterium]|nr:metallophosphoesterase family protein [Thermomicrobiales bacterium]
MKVAIFSDVHGNSIALDAVLRDIAPEHVDAFWVIGDLVALGPDPSGSARMLAALPDATFVRGNTDRYVVNGDVPGGPAQLEAARQDPERLPRYLRLFSNFPWARGAIAATGHYAWLAQIPLEIRVTLPDGTRVLLVHAAPGTDDGPGIPPQDVMSDDDLASVLAGADADLVIVGHTHVPLDRTVDGVTVHNLGSVSVPKTDEPRAMWTLLTADESGHTLERRFVEYDVAKVHAALDAAHHPYADAIKEMIPLA